jgi:hypothetical protein
MTDSSSNTETPLLSKTCDRRYSPAVARYWLMLVAGLLWSGVGITLCIVACSWLALSDWPESGWNAVLGVGIGTLAHRFGFSVIARRNIKRITQKPDRVCLFAFQAWPSYVLIIFMASLGFALRQSLLSRQILAMIYLIVGTGLALSSSLYYTESL